MKRRAIIFSVTVLFLLFAGNALAADVSLPPAVKKAVESRVLVGVSCFGLWERQGTGFVAAEGGYVITASHLFDDIPPAAVERTPILVGKSSNDEPTKAKLITRDPTKDLALIKVEEPEKIGPPVMMAVAFPKNQETVYFSGFSLVGGELRADTFKADTLYEIGSMTIGEQTISGVVMLDRQIPPGFSGGPVYNLKGELIGMNSFTTNIGSGGIIRLEPIKDILKEIRQEK